MKKIFVLLLIFLITITNICPLNAAASQSFDEECVKIYTGGGTESNVLNDMVSRSVYVEIENPSRARLNISFSFKICDINGAEVQTLNKDITVKGRTTYTESIAADLLYGTYTATAKLSGTFGTITKSVSLANFEYGSKHNDGMGVSAHIMFKWDNDIIASEKIRDAGFGWIRDDFPWKDVEKQKGVINITPEMDKYVNSICEKGNKLLLILASCNPLYESGNFPLTDEGIAAYVRYCVEVVKHYKGKLSAVEIFNEPDLKSFTGIDINGAQYTKLLKEAYTAIKKVDPELTVAGGAICSLRNESAQVFLDEMLEAGAHNYMDVFSYHPYVYSGKYCDESAVINGIQYLDFADQIEYAKTKFAAAGKPDMPLWMTEFGTTTHIDDWGATYEEQAVNLVRASAISKSFGAADKLFVYTLKNTGLDPKEYEHNFGLLDYEYNEKPSYIALSAFNSMVADMNDSQVLEFSKPDNKIDSVQYNITSNPPQSGKVEVSFSARYDENAVVIGPEIIDDAIGDGVLGVEAHGGKIVTNSMGTVSEEYILLDSYIPNKWYDFKMTMDFESGTYDISVSSKGKMIKTLSGLDMIGMSPKSRDKRLGTAKYFGWRNWSSKGVGGAIDNLKITHTDGKEKVILFDGFEEHNTIDATSGYAKHKYSDVYAQPEKDEALAEKIGYTVHRYSDREKGKTTHVLWTPEGTQRALSIERDMAEATDSHIASASGEDRPVLHTSSDAVIRYYDIYGNELELSDDSGKTVTDKPMYIVCTPRLKVEAVDGKIIASGSDAKPDGLVSILAVNETKPGRAIEYIRQVRADSDGTYKFEFEPPINENQSVYVCAGEAVDVEQLSTGNLGISIDYFVNNQPYESIGQLSGGDKLRGIVSIERKSGTIGNPIFYSCVYGDNGELLSIDYEKVEQSETDIATAETEITIGNEKNTGGISFYLWNENFTPVISGIKEERNEDKK